MSCETTKNMFQLVFVFVFLSWILVIDATSLGGGSAQALAQMNMELMGQNKNCPIVPCQSACMKKNVKSGCYECSCGSGSSIGMAGGPNINMGGGSMMGCSNLNGYFNCPSICQATVNAWGCTECKCQGQKETGWKSEGQPDTVPTTPDLRTTVPLKTPTGQTVPRTAISFTTQKQTTKSTTPTTIAPTLKVYATSTVPTTTVTAPTQNSFETTSYRQTLKNLNSESLARTTERNTYKNGNKDSMDENAMKDTVDKTNVIIIFVLTTVLIVSLTVCIVFLIAWRRTARELRKQRNEVYFFHKSVRQELSNKPPGLPEPVYAHITSTPEPPPRTPPISPLTPNAPSTNILLRTVSLSSETPLKETDAELQSRHDYLQLI